MSNHSRCEASPHPTLILLFTVYAMEQALSKPVQLQTCTLADVGWDETYMQYFLGNGLLLGRNVSKIISQARLITPPIHFFLTLSFLPVMYLLPSGYCWTPRRPQSKVFLRRAGVLSSKLLSRFFSSCPLPSPLLPFQIWYETQTPELQASVQSLVASGQLQFLNGGWSSEYHKTIYPEGCLKVKLFTSDRSA